MNEKIDLFETIETKRLILRKIVNDDAKDLYKNIYNNYEYYKYYYQLPFENFEEYSLLVQKYENWYNNGNHFRWGIVLKDSNEMIGLVQLHTKDELNKNCKIAYIIGYKYNGKGYAKEAVENVIDFAFNKLNYHRIEAEIVDRNVKSIKLAESLGMKEERVKYESYLLQKTYLDQKVYTKINNN